MLALEDRPAASKMLAALRAGDLQGIVVWKLDRLARDPAIVLPISRELDRRGLVLLSVTETVDVSSAAGEFGTTVLSAAARYERRLIIERSIAGSNRVAREGKWLGGIVPYGYRLDTDRCLTVSEVPIPGLPLSEADVVRQIFKRCGVDGWGTVKIASELNALHVPTTYARDERSVAMGDVLGTRGAGKRRRRTAGTWSPGAVLRLLHSEAYAGTHRYGRRSARKRDLIARPVKPIVSPAQYERAQAQLRANFRFAVRHSRKAYLLRGLLTCGQCGHALIGTHYKTRLGDVLQYTCCSHPREQLRPRIRADTIETAIWNDVMDFVEHPSKTLKLLAQRVQDGTRTEATTERDLVATATAIEHLDRDERRVVDLAIADLDLSPTLLQEKLLEIRQRRDGLQDRLNALRSERAHVARKDVASAGLARTLKTLADRVRKANATKKAEAFRLLVVSAVVLREGHRYRLNVTYAFPQPDQELAFALDTGRDSSRPRG
jgi:site-specific DNA recombinase